MLRISVVLFFLLAVSTYASPASGQVRQSLEYRPAPVDNPLKGLVPYQGDVRDKFPHSMEFNYLPYSALVKGDDQFDWKPLEVMLDDIASRGHQSVFRIYLEYPGQEHAIPDFLIKEGLKVHQYKNTDSQDRSSKMLETPDYQNKNLRRSLKNFIAALGQKYDGDPRIGFITAGLLGAWGEWHTYPKEELFASKEVQLEVMDAYQNAFKKTAVLLRYPAGENDSQKAKNSDRPFGYHDDSFAWATLHTGKESDSWFYMTALMEAGSDAETKWKSQPIGGEIRPEAWGRVFDKKPASQQIQNFRECIAQTHASWLMDSGMFEKKQKSDRIQRAEEEVRRMGYEFHVSAVTVDVSDQKKLAITLEIENRGVAPFYYDWQPEYGLIAQGKVVKTFEGSGKLTGLLPGDKPRKWVDSLDLSGLSLSGLNFSGLNLSGLGDGEYVLAVRVPNMLKTGKPIRFANTTQDVDAEGWLSLVVVP